MEILFSQGPTEHSRLANSLLWMARAYPQLQQLDDNNFLFPWARENYAGFLDLQSPWLTNPSAAAENLFERISGRALTASSLATLSRQLEADHENLEGLEPHAWSQLVLRQTVQGVDLAYLVGADLEFRASIEEVRGVDLVIVHEPFQLHFEGPRFPMEGLGHLAPAPALLEAADRRQAAINPEALPCCGLHIRRGDYSYWHNGRYFYDDSFWLDLADRLLGEGMHVSLFTNDPEGALCGRLSDRGVHFSGGSPGEDLVRMMLMDRVIGPPSTFPLLARTLGGFCLQRNLVYEMLPAMEPPVEQAEAS